MFPQSELDRLLHAMRANGVTCLDLRGKGRHLRLALDGAHSPAPVPAGARLLEIKSPGIGTFAPRGADDGLSPLDPEAAVTEGETLGYLCDGALRLPVAASGAGRLTGPLPAPGVLVGYGDILFTLEIEA